MLRNPVGDTGLWFQVQKQTANYLRSELALWRTSETKAGELRRSNFGNEQISDFIMKGFLAYES